MFVKPDTGMLVFNLFKSTHIADAYKCGKEIVVSSLRTFVILVLNDANVFKSGYETLELYVLDK